VTVILVSRRHTVDLVLHFKHLDIFGFFFKVCLNVENIFRFGGASRRIWLVFNEIWNERDGWRVDESNFILHRCERPPGVFCITFAWGGSLHEFIVIYFDSSVTAVRWCDRILDATVFLCALALINSQINFASGDVSEVDKMVIGDVQETMRAVRVRFLSVVIVHQ